MFGQLIGRRRPVDLDDLRGRRLEVPGARDEGLVHRRILALQDHPVLADIGGAPRSQLPESIPAGIGRQDLAHREVSKKALRALLRIGRQEIEIVDRDSSSQKLGAQADPEVEFRVEVVKAVGNEEVSILHARHFAMADPGLRGMNSRLT